MASDLPSSHQSLVRERAIGVFKFLRELTGLRSKTVRDSSQYDVWWLKDLPQEASCHFIGWQPVGEVDPGTPWIEVTKPRLNPPPSIAANLLPWIIEEQVRDSRFELPELLESIELTTVDGEGPKTLLLAEHPEVSEQWTGYLEKHWLPWASRDRIQQRIQAKYSSLFSIYQKQQALGENYEIVLSLGHLAWRAPSGYEVGRHLVTAQTSMTFDDVRGVIRVGIAADGAKLALEHDMLDVEDRPSAGDIEDQLRDSEFVMWDGQTIADALRGWVHRLRADSEYNDTFACADSAGSKPIVTLAPALVMRKRSARTLLELFKNLIARYEAGANPSMGIEHLVAIVDDDSQDGSGAERDGVSRPLETVELFLPLPANDEQRLIVSKMQHTQGVLVQGPPGTGKSHTIANLLCHLLADGKRVLVTSHTVRALAVLREKLPAEISDLCVQLLGNDLSALKGLENSVREITQRYNDRNDEQSRNRLAVLEKSLDDIRRAAARAQYDLRCIRETDIETHGPIYGEYSGTTLLIARQVRDREPAFGWILEFTEGEAPVPVTDGEALELVELSETLEDVTVAASNKTRPLTDELPNPSRFAESVEAVAEAKLRRDSLLRTADASIVSRIDDLADDDLRTIQTIIAKLFAATGLEYSESWLDRCRADLLSRNPRMWEELLSSSEQGLKNLGGRAKWASDLQVSGLDGLDDITVLAHSTVLLDHFSKGGGLGFGPFKSPGVKQANYIIKSVRVNGVLCNNLQTVSDLCSFLEVRRELRKLGELWEHVVKTPKAAIAIEAAQFIGLTDRLSTALALGRLIEQADVAWREAGQTEPLWLNESDLKRSAASLDYLIAARNWAKAMSPIDVLSRSLRNVANSQDVHESAQMLANAVQELDPDAYRNAYAYLKSIEASAMRVQRKSNLEKLLADAPKLLHYLAASPDRDEVRERVRTLSAAWNWACAHAWIRRMAEPNARLKLESEIERCKKAERRCITQLAAEKAWACCFASMTSEQRRHLVAWQQEIKKLGKGTGKHAWRHRKQAREELEKARGAVPAWIMPIYRLADTINVESDRFDVIIVDEASQSGPEAMFLLEFAKKIIIVGDDKQIKPDVFVDHDVVDRLRRQFIPEIPSSTLIGSPDTSLFEIGELLYGSRVRLREHFRCMPEIIQFSNNLCYRSEPLIPLRQFGQSRLKPVVVAHHVDAGYQKGRPGRIVNPPEAESVVNFIANAIRKPEYSKKTFGVISLLGDDQARLIEQLLVARIGPEEMQRRHLICGDAYAFQGDERDVMLLSMVSAPTEGARIGVLSKSTDERRFNVAASRARDQMVLFHSATLSDLNPNCMRHKLLEYCRDPKVDPLEVAGHKLEQLKALASSERRRQENPPEPFDSWFEVDVCIAVMEHGYRVVPQYEIAGYYVDLMVEGTAGRIAVECDGDAWHGPEQFDRDMFRQRELERAGLRFFRPRGSEYYREPGTCLAPLWRLLEEQNSDVTDYEGAVARPASETRSSDRVEGRGGRGRGDEMIAEISDQDLESDALEPLELELELEDQANTPSSLPPYQEWPARPLPDPRTCGTDDVIRGLLEIARVEGPVTCSRMYRRYARAANIQRVGHQLRSIFNRAAAQAVRSGALMQSADGTGQAGRTVWLPQKPSVLVRQRGPRTADEIPATEIKAVADQLTARTSVQIDALVELVAEKFGIGRLTVSTRATFRKILEREINSEGADAVASASLNKRLQVKPLVRDGEDTPLIRAILECVPDAGKISREALFAAVARKTGVSDDRALRAAINEAISRAAIEGDLEVDGFLVGRSD